MGSVEGAQRILSGLKEAGVDLVASGPDINVLELINLLYESRDITHIPVGREEEGIGVCTGAGAYLGGRKPAILMQNGVFRTNSATVPEHSGHPFRSNPATLAGNSATP